MAESWYRYMNVGTLHFMSFPEVGKGEGPVTETLGKILQDDFFTAVEITHIKDDAVREQVKKMLETSHVIASYVTHPRLLSNKLDINSLVEAERKKAVAAVKEGIEEAAYLGATGVSTLSGPHPGKGLENEGVQRLLESLGEFCEYSRKYGLDLRVGDLRLRRGQEMPDRQVRPGRNRSRKDQDEPPELRPHPGSVPHPPAVRTDEDGRQELRPVQHPSAHRQLRPEGQEPSGLRRPASALRRDRRGKRRRSIAGVLRGAVCRRAC